MDAVGAERLDGQRGGHRRVDASGDADDDVAEAVLLHVVAQPELQRQSHLLELVQARRERGRGLARVGVGLADVHDRRVGQLTAVPREGAPPDVPQAPSHGLGRLDVDDEQRLFEAGAAGDQVTFLVEHERMAVEDQLVLAADGVAEGDETGVVARAGGEHLLALAIAEDVERRGREVGQDLRAGESELGRRRPGLPHVLADRGADQRAAVLEQQELSTGCEVAVLVEDAVVRQEPLAVQRLELAGGADGARVVEVAVEPRDADEGGDAARRACHLLGRGLGRADEARPEEQVLRRVARDRKLGEEDEIGFLRFRLLQSPEDALGVAVEIADDGVDLGEREPHSVVLDYQSKTC